MGGGRRGRRVASAAAAALWLCSAPALLAADSSPAVLDGGTFHTTLAGPWPRHSPACVLPIPAS